MYQGTTEAVQIPGASSQDVLTGILREGAQKLLAQAVEAEVDAYIRQHANRRSSPRVLPAIVRYPGIA